jgi:hypothetical protein
VVNWLFPEHLMERRSAMKQNLITAVIGFGLGVGVVCSQTLSDIPSHRLSQKERFLLGSSSDMRLFLCDYTTLSNRISRQVCLVDSIHPTNTSNTVYTREIPVGSGVPLRQVLKDAKMDYSARQPRIFSENTIRQAPVFKKWDDPEAIQFRETLIHPGDLVILTFTREW